ncbi:MAG TPA: hypothetical protein VIT64_11835 [Ilumatobacteraceae bacterium]
MTERSGAAPSDNTTLTEVLAAYAAEGFDAEFELVDGSGDLHCSTCGSTLVAEQVPLHSIRRLEGASDPDDMLAVCAVTCRNCAAQGAVVVRYGPGATIEEAEFLGRAKDRRDDAAAPPDSAPGEEHTPAR